MTLKSRADLHCHTCHSGFTNFSVIPFPESVTPPEEMVHAAVKAGISVLGITDHDTIAGSKIARRYVAERKLDIDIVLGEEITTSDGELLGVFLEEHIPKGLPAAETIERIHSQGGLAIAPHPFSYQCPSLGPLIADLKLDGIETLNAGHRDNYVNRIAGLRCNSSMARMGGSDAHTTMTMGNAYTLFDGQGPEDLFKAIKNGTVSPEGKLNTIWDYIGWSVEMAQGVSRKLMVPRDEWSPDDPLGRMNRMMPHNRAIALIGSALYVSTPLPLLAGALGEGMVRYRGKQMWGRVMDSSGKTGSEAE